MIMIQIAHYLSLTYQLAKPDDCWSDEEPKNDESDNDDEKPVVVVLKPGDLTAKEAEDHAALEGHQKSGGENG